MAGTKFSKQRQAIIDYLCSTTEHPTAETVYTNVRISYPNVSLGTVYRNLNLLAEEGEILRLTCGDAKWIYDHCPAGTVVEIFDGTTETVPEKPPSLFLDPESPYRGWDPTDPSADNPWKSLPISIHRVEDLKVERGSDVDLLKNVFALDVDGKTLLEVQVSGTVDLNRCGTYIVAYSAVGATGAEKTVYATVTVVESEDGEVS